MVCSRTGLTSKLLTLLGGEPILLLAVGGGPSQERFQHTAQRAYRRRSQDRRPFGLLLPFQEVGPTGGQATLAAVSQGDPQMDLTADVLPLVHSQLHSAELVVGPGDPHSLRQLRQNVRSLWWD